MLVTIIIVVSAVLVVAGVIAACVIGKLRGKTGCSGCSHCPSKNNCKKTK